MVHRYGTSQEYMIRERIPTPGKMDSIKDVKLSSLGNSNYVKPLRMHYTQNGIEKMWDLIKIHNSVSIIIYNTTRQVLVFVKQFRPAVYFASIPECDQEMKIDTSKYPPETGITLELCAGIVDKDLPLEEIAKIEVLEECGYDVPVSNFERIISYRSGIGVCGDNQTLFYAEVTDNMKIGKGGGNLEEGEFIEVVEMTVPEAKKYMDKGTVLSPVPIHAAPEVDLESQAGSLDRYIPPFRLTESGNGANGFMLVGDEGETESLSHHVRVTASLFDILSGNSQVDHPLCEECTDALLDLMDQQLKLTEDEWNDYNQFLERLEAEDEDQGIESLEKELADLRAEEQRLLQELATLQEAELATKKAIAEQRAEHERLDGEEERYLREYARHRRDQMLTDDELISLKCQINYAQAQLEKLKKTNVFNATFHIWHSGHFGTINNFRLGRLPSAPVDWSEINAAWGQTALLLTALARKMNLTFQRFRLVPYGNHSYIEVSAEDRELPLYGSGGFRFLWDRKFDSAMVAFLDCLQQFKEEVEKGDSGFCLPYRMERDKIEDSATGNSYSIRIQFNSEEQWTKALKFLLTNLKWGLAWVSSQFTKDEAESLQH